MLTALIIVLLLALAGLFTVGRSIDKTTRRLRDRIRTYLNTSR